MSHEPEAELELEIAHILLIDVVGYSTLLVNEQIELMQQLNHIVRCTDRFRSAEAKGKLMRLPTGDGMALLFFDSAEAPVQCALEIARTAKAQPNMALRMGAHSGPIKEIPDVNERINFAGSGINLAQRVLDCGDADHILLSARLAEDLFAYRHWHPHLRDLGECEVKHGVKLHLFNLCKDGLGNPVLPEKVRLQRGRLRKWRTSIARWAAGSPRRRAALAAAGFGVVAALLLGGWFAFQKSTHQLGPPLRPIPAKSIAVLPFENLGDEKLHTYLAEGVQDEILTGLARVADLKVISRTSVMQYKSKTDAPRNLPEIARALGVNYVVEGSVQRDGDRVRISAQLIDARTDMHIWAERYDRELADVFAIESEVAQEIVSQLKAEISPAERAAIAERPTADIAAYGLYAHAKTILNTAALGVREKERLFEAEQLLQQAVTRDRAFFLAYYQLARTHDRLYILGIDHTPARLAMAEAAINTALQLRPDAGEGHLALAAHLYSYLDYDRAREELATAERALPNEPLVFELGGYIDRRQGRWEECVRNLRRAQELDPRNFFNLQQLGLAFEKMRRFPEMISSLDRALMLIPGDAGTQVQRAMAYLEWRGDPKPLHANIQTLLGQNPGAVEGIAGNWLTLALAQRDYDAADRALASMTADGCRNEGVPLPRGWCEGVAARARGDSAAANAAFILARSEIEKTVNEQPSYAEALCVLGLVDAGLGRKNEAISSGKRAAELLPITKDAINGPLLVQYLAVIYAWSGETDLALEQLEIVSRVPSDVNYGNLKLHPCWDPLRGNPRFEKIVDSLAPK